MAIETPDQKPTDGKSASHQCKGANGQTCTQTVTYLWKPVFSLTEKKRETPKEVQTAYLTCVLGHTNPYTIDGEGYIIG